MHLAVAGDLASRTVINKGCVVYPPGLALGHRAADDIYAVLCGKPGKRRAGRAEALFGVIGKIFIGIRACEHLGQDGYIRTLFGGPGDGLACAG